MTHLADRPRQANPNYARAYENSRQVRAIGGATVNRTDMARLGGEMQLPLAEKLRRGALAATFGQIGRVRELYKRENGRLLPDNADTVQLAYISQVARLKDKRVTDDLTQSQLTYELMAKAILLAPQASDAIRTAHHHKSKATLSRYNDILGEIARSLPAHMAPGYKTAVVEALKLGSLELNRRIGHSSEVSGKDPESRIDRIRAMMNGVQDEIAPENALQRDPGLRVEIPQDTASDLVGIDMIVSRVKDGKTILIDTKAHGKYLSTVAEKQDKEWVNERNVGPYYFDGMHETGYPHFLLNASAFGEIPADGFDYTPAGQAQLRRTVHQMLDL